MATEIDHFEPHRGDEVERWLIARRDACIPEIPPRHSDLHFMQYKALNDALDDYRLHADTGTPLDAEVRERE